MNIPFLQANSSNFYSGRGGNSIKYIVMHYTANNGDTAMNNAQFFHNNSVKASAHYFVDENSVVLRALGRQIAVEICGKLFILWTRTVLCRASAIRTVRGTAADRWKARTIRCMVSV